MVEINSDIAKIAQLQQSLAQSPVQVARVLTNQAKAATAITRTKLDNLVGAETVKTWAACHAAMKEAVSPFLLENAPEIPDFPE